MLVRKAKPQATPWSRAVPTTPRHNVDRGAVRLGNQALSESFTGSA